jgi:hypothetical protein
MGRNMCPSMVNVEVTGNGYHNRMDTTTGTIMLSANTAGMQGAL